MISLDKRQTILIPKASLIALLKLILCGFTILRQTYSTSCTKPLQAFNEEQHPQQRINKTTTELKIYISGSPSSSREHNNGTYLHGERLPLSKLYSLLFLPRNKLRVSQYNTINQTDTLPTEHCLSPTPRALMTHFITPMVLPEVQLSCQRVIANILNESQKHSNGHLSPKCSP